jgi:hypothetical protein
LTSIKWQGKFTEVAGQFAAHKQALQFELQIHLSVEMTNANETLAEVNENVKLMMKVVFEAMNTPEEKDLAVLAQNKGGVDVVLADDHTLKQVLAKQSKGKDEKGGGRPKDVNSVDSGALTLGEFKHELDQDVEVVLAENSKHFEQKFAAMELSLKEVTVTIQRQSDRVIEEILAGVNAGPHERIVDRVSPTLIEVLSLIEICLSSGHLRYLEGDGALAVRHLGVPLIIEIVGLEGKRKSDTSGAGTS